MGACGVSAESEASVGKKKCSPYDRYVNIATATQHFMPITRHVIEQELDHFLKTFFKNIHFKIFSWVPLTHENYSY